MFALLFLLLSSVADAGEAPRAKGGPQKIEIPQFKYETGRLKNRADLRHYNRYSTGQLAGFGGTAVSVIGLGVAGMGLISAGGFESASGLEVDRGMGYAGGALLSAGALIAAGGAIGAGRAVDAARKKRPVPQVAGTLGMVLAGSSVAIMGLAVYEDNTDFAMIGAATAAVGTFASVGQLAQNSSSAPRRWPSIWVDTQRQGGGFQIRL